MSSKSKVHLSAQEIAQTVSGRIEGNSAVVIEGAATLQDASDRDLSFYHNPKYADLLMTTKAAAILVPEKANGITFPTGKTLIQVANPQWAFAQVLSLLARDRVHLTEGIHPQAVIDPSARVSPGVSVGAHVVIERDVVIGAGTIIYPGCYIGERSHIGTACLMYPNVVLREETHLGDNVIIHAGAVLGADGYGFSKGPDGRHRKIPQIGRVVVEEDVEIGANVTVDRATTGETRIGAGTKIDNLVHIAHNVHIGRNCLIVALVGISGSVRIGHQVTLGGQVGMVGHITIGDGVMVAAQSGIMNDVKPGEVLFGTPARPHKEAMKLQALFSKLPEMYDFLKTLKKRLLPSEKPL